MLNRFRRSYQRRMKKRTKPTVKQRTTSSRGQKGKHSHNHAPWETCTVEDTFESLISVMLREGISEREALNFVMTLTEDNYDSRLTNHPLFKEI